MSADVIKGDKAHAAIDIRNVTIAFDDQAVLTRFSLTVAGGERVCLRGASGSGKSTLFRCLLGLHVPQSGQIWIAGKQVSPDTIWRLRGQIAWVPQGPDWGQTRVRTLLELPFTFQSNRAQRTMLDQMPDRLAQVDLPVSILEKRADSLSGGEKQRLALVAALLLNRPILLVDEGTSGLDAENRDRIRKCLGAETRDRTILAISHEAEAETWCDRLVDLETGHA